MKKKMYESPESELLEMTPAFCILGYNDPVPVDDFGDV